MTQKKLSPISSSAWTAAAMLACGFVTCSSLRADVLVITSTVPGISRGDQLNDDTRLQIPPGKSVMVMRPAGQTQTVPGPYDRLIKEISRGEKTNERMWRELKDQFDKERSIGSNTAGTRGVSR